jgi:hypothetical protein
MRLVYDHAARRAFMRDGKPIEDKAIERAVLLRGPQYAAKPCKFFRLVPPAQMANVVNWREPPPSRIALQSIIEVEIVNREPRSLRPRLGDFRVRWQNLNHDQARAVVEHEKALLREMAKATAPAPAAPAPAPKARWCHADQYIQKLEDRGYVRLGSGCFSTVLAKPGSDRVIKVGRNLDAWPDYVLWAARKGYGGTWAPRLFSFRRHKCHNGEFYVAVIERLENTIHGLKKGEDKRHSQFESDRLALARILKNTLPDDDGAAADVDEKMPGALRFCIRVRAWQASIGAGFDLHSENWMVAGERLVLTDPVTESRGRTSTAPRRVTSRELQPAL